MKLHTIALGCQMSEADAVEMSKPLRLAGFSTAETPQEADAILISTCTVRQHAEDRAVSLIGSLRPWKEENPHRILIVTGCAAQRLEGWIQTRFPHVDLVVGAKSIESFPEIVQQALGQRFNALAEDQKAFPEQLGSVANNSLPAQSSSAAAYVTIMRGCNYSCSYCIVPSVRGRELYRPVKDVLADIQEKISQGAREITLLGQTVNSYYSVYQDKPVRFPELLRLADQIPGLKRLRFMSPHPYYADERMFLAMSECASVCEQLHLPVQSGSNRLLKLMRRNYTRESYFEKIKRARQLIPNLVISTDIIVGFPTETEEDFQASLDLLEELRPAGAYCFKYSPREGTESASWPDDVPKDVKEKRLERLNNLMDRLTAEALKDQVSKEMEVLCEDKGFGRSRGGFKVKWKGEDRPGDLTQIRISAAGAQTLVGERK